MTDHPDRLSLPRLLLALGLLVVAAARADSPPPALPDWQVLEYEQRGWGVTAKSRLDLEAASASEAIWRLTASSSISDNSETVTVTLDPASGRALSRERLSRGRDQRFKSWEFHDDQAVRTRRTPGRNDSAPPSEWPVSTQLEVKYPAKSAGMVITDVYALPLLAGRLLDGDGGAAEVVVYTDFNFYRVRMTQGPGPEVKVDYRVEGEANAVKGRVATRMVTLAVSPLVPLEDKPDFSLLGLEGDITLLFDPTTGVPVQLRGKAPRVGKTSINLRRVVPRKPEA